LQSRLSYLIGIRRGPVLRGRPVLLNPSEADRSAAVLVEDRLMEPDVDNPTGVGYHASAQGQGQRARRAQAPESSAGDPESVG
jgi:hypothetical protein